jgi:steroid delta-isomerase
MAAPPIVDVLERYAAFVSAGDVDGIVSLYAPDATIEIPVGGPVHRGIDAIRAFYRDNELAQSLAVTGPACAAGSEAAVAMRARIVRADRTVDIDVIDVASIDDEGRITRLRAFFDLGAVIRQPDGPREVGGPAGGVPRPPG